MNLTENTANFSKDFWFKKYGSTWLNDSLHLFGLLPINLIGFILNILSLYLINKKGLNSNFYIHFRAYLASSVTFNFIMIFASFANIKRYFQFSNSYLVNFYFSFIVIPLCNLTINYGIFLEIFMSFEKFFLFFPQKNLRIFRKNPLKIWLFLFFGALFLNGQNFFVFRPDFIEIQTNSEFNFKINFIRKTDFHLTKLGHILNYLSFNLLFCLVIQIALNVATGILLKKHFIKKRNLMSNLNAIREPQRRIFDEQSMEQIEQRQLLYETISCFPKINKKNMKIIKMVASISILSILMTIFFLVLIIYTNHCGIDQTQFLLGAFTTIFASLKYSSNFFIFRFFDKNFTF
jgi:hypothetical protein